MWRIRIPINFRPNDPRHVVVVYPHTINIQSILPSGIRSSLDHIAHNDALRRHNAAMRNYVGIHKHRTSPNPALAAVHGQAALLLHYDVPTYYISRELLAAAS